MFVVLHSGESQTILLDDEVYIVVGNCDVDWGKCRAANPGVGLNGGPSGVLQELWQNVVQRHLDVGEGGVDVTGDPYGRGEPVAVLRDALDHAGPPLNHICEPHLCVYNANVTILDASKPQRKELFSYEIKYICLMPHNQICR